MASFTILVAALLINSLSHCSAESLYCVTPTATTSCSPCPHTFIKCTTLSEFAQEAKSYFADSNITVVFLPGDHILDTSVTVSNVVGLTMRGESSSGNKTTIVCSGLVGFSFTSTVELKIESLAITSCSRKYRSSSFSNYALLLQSTQHTELVNCSFHDNLGTALVVDNTTVTLAGTTVFTHNHCDSDTCIGGGGIVALNSNIAFMGNTTFFENKATFYNPYKITSGGGAIFASNNAVLSFNGTSNFIDNSIVYGLGGAIFASDKAVLSFSGNSTFISNSAIYYSDGGAIYVSDNAAVIFNGNSNFITNSADNNGGAIYASKNTVLGFNGANNFINNTGAYGGGAIYGLDNVGFNGTNIFGNNSAYYGGAIVMSNNTVFNFTGTYNFSSNSAHAGGAIYTFDNVVSRFSGTSNFIGNFAADSGGAICVSGNTVLSFNGVKNFVNNSASYGGAIFANINNTLVFNAIIKFANNGHNRDRRVTQNGDTAYGGGVYLGLQSTFSILPNTTVYWENNHASFGGAIYVIDSSRLSYCTSLATYVPKAECFFQLPGQNLSNAVDAQLVFKNNSADVAGSVLYGGAIDNCRLTGLDTHINSGDVFDMIVHNSDTGYNTAPNISSIPLHICQCVNDYVHCSKNKKFKEIFVVAAYPGETFQVSAVAVGQRDGAVPSTVRSIVNPGKLEDYQYLHQTNNSCTKLNYTVFSLSPVADIYMYVVDSLCSKFNSELILGSYEMNIHVYLHQTCPPGFNISASTESCVCEPRLRKYIGIHQCKITKGLGQITRDSSQHFWVGYDNQSHGLILHPHCPFDFCTSNTVIFPLNNTDIQCAYNRSGLLCGQCKKGYSLVLGISHCKKCTNIFLVLLISFAVMGIALVFLLLVCKLTVATGALSGLVFYANIIGANRTIFLPGESTNVFSIFVAWLNLDFGIETCFFNGLDSYSKTWLEFAFPVYLWMIIGFIIFGSNFSRRFAKLLGNNPVSVLATLILLSYTKILRTLITVLYITYLEYPTYNRMVWLYDANIDYLSGKHIPLFLVAVLVFLFLFLPYTIVLLFGQWLQAVSHLRLFSWVNRLTPFLDAYHAPYKAKHRYWPGLLLVFRFALLLVFAFNFQEDTDINLLALVIGTGMLVVWAWISGGVYRNWCLDALEGSFALNLIILATSTMYINHSKGDELPVVYTSVSIAFATFIGILVFQLAKVTGIVRYLKKCAALKRCIIRDGEREMESDTDSLPDRLINILEYEPVCQTTQEHTVAAEHTGYNRSFNEEPKRLVPAYTYSSLS